jgi:cytochrome c biogenesis protein CcmG, thiol:disulfide interchange protein DsbE
MPRIALLLAAPLLWIAAEPEDDIVRNRPVDEAARNEKLNAMEGEPALSIASEDWSNTTPIDWPDLRGKVVLLDFWGVWCRPCVNAIPELRKLYREHQDDGLVVIGVHTEESAKRGKRFVEKEGIEYPIVYDDNDRIAKAFLVNHYPSYYLVDREGRLRMADIADTELTHAIEWLLDEE